ncbi:MAG: hypothetical protein FWF52_01390 [Candidatus Azobacteroides sp.]|nr:hypothetical protein [Candidatus Azobacteroides sp.]
MGRLFQTNLEQLMNPIKITLLTLGAWIMLTIIYVFSVEDASEKPFAVAVYSFYLAPFVCTIAFIISLFFYRSWTSNHKIAIVAISALLISWALYIVFYIGSLFI